MTRTPRLLLFAVVLLGYARAGAWAVPIDISAQQSLEWYEETGLYVARGQARAVRGTTTVEADLLTAHRAQGGDIENFTANGNVRISDGPRRLFGQRAFYDTQEGVFKISGAGLKYVMNKDIVTARDSIEYHENKGVALARGRAMADHDGNRIEADVLSATFDESAGNQKTMKKMMAQGSVVVVTKDGAIARSERAVYDVTRDAVVLLENVRITQGQTQLAGDEAEIDFKNGKSRILNGGGGRVRALLPSAPQKKEKKP